MSSANVAVIEQMISAFTKHDIDKALSCLHKDVVLNEADSLPYGGDFVGHAGFKSFLAKLSAVFDIEVNKAEVVDAGPKVLVRADITVKSRANGRSVSMPIVELYSVIDGQVRHIDVYYKDAKAMSDLLAA